MNSEFKDVQISKVIVLLFIVGCLLFGTLAHAQTTLDGFWGIPWSTSQTDAKAKILAQKGLTVDASLTNADALMCDGGCFNGKKIYKCALLFVDNRFCHAQVIFKPTPTQLIFEYREWVADFTRKYGKPQNVWDSGLLKDGDDRLPDAVRAGKASFATAWEFPVTNKAVNAIIVEINDALLLTVTYENGKLMNERQQRQKAKFGRDL